MKLTTKQIRTLIRILRALWELFIDLKKVENLKD